MRKEFLRVFVMTALIVSLTLTSVSITYSGGLPFVSVDPQTTTIGVGMDFKLNVTITEVTDPALYSFTINMTFNPDILNCTDVEEGPFLKQAGSTDWSETIPPPEYGWVSFSDWLVPGVPSGATGSGTLASLHFKASDVGSTDLNFTKVTLLTKVGYFYQKMDQEPPVNGTVTVTGGHDVAVVSLTAPAEAASSSSVPINVTVRNEGSETEKANVTIRYDSTYIDSQNVTLLAGEPPTTVSFTWDTSGVGAGTYTINATATISLDDDPTDNSKNTTIRIVEHDVAVTNIDAPSKARVGATVPISVAVENQGNATENLNVTVSHGVTLIGFNDTVVLPAQNSAIVPFEWETTGLTPGEYTINATATILTIPVDDDPTDSSRTTKIKLEKLHDVAVISMETPTWAPLGDIVSINVTVKNEGDFDEPEVNVTIRYDSTYIDSQNLTLNKGENDTALLNWNTAGLTPGYYYVKATATIPDDDDPGDNYDQKLVILIVHDVNVTSITAPPKGYVGYSVNIDVTVINEGSPFFEKVNVTLKYDTLLIGNKTVTLDAGQSLNVSFTWDLTGVTPGSYVLTANATVLESTYNRDAIDDDPLDNILVDGIVFVIIPGDVDVDGDVDASDLFDLGKAYGSEPEDINWNENCDFNGDNKVDVSDLTDLSKNYGKTV